MFARRRGIGERERLALIFALVVFGSVVLPRLADLAGDDAAIEEAAATAIGPEDLATLSDEQLDAAVLDLIHDAIDQDWDRRDQILAAMPPGYLPYYTMTLIEEDLRYAGFIEAALWSDDHLESAIRGYRMIGAEAHAAIVEDAMALYWQEDHAWDECRHHPDCEVTDYLAGNELDVRWFAAEAAGDDPIALRAAYVRAHPDEFGVAE